ncbi:cell division protein FtsI [Sphaerisporangium album]|uniref:Cell division protein FtsI n=1 Tax=Sphaerisporangium album TaxID=509200 RepID=A0A367F253_9ACTN|nr:penicillin-binding transpeptidase domain-containing protein [Sphaerisporangium album]RCG24029.1 cell division protein FtsI [Sphaerisporangium album]
MRNRWPLAMVAAVIMIVLFGLYMLVTGPRSPTASAVDLTLPASPTTSPTATSDPPPAASTPPESAPAVPSSFPSTPAVPSQPPAVVPPTSAPAVARPGDPGPVAERYFAAWRLGDFPAMASLVADPPPDFADRHRRFTAELRIASVSLSPGPLTRPGADTAEVAFQGVRQVTGLGPWPFSSVLRLAVRGGAWKVLWSPETLHPALKDGGSLRLDETKVKRPGALTKDGKPFPSGSRAGDHFPGLDATFTELKLREQPSGKVLLASQPPSTAQTRTTISGPVQEAAARALDGVARPAALVAVDVASGEVRAVADTLGGKGAFNGLYPPGSAFKVVTAAALLRSGLAPDAQVPCPGAYTIPNARRFTNDGGADHGVVSLTTAFALSCNTTFVQQSYERLRDDRLRAEAADRFGFREKPGLSSCRISPSRDMNELGADAIGQNSVRASPLCMAEVAAAVAGGTWRQAVVTPGASAGSPPVPLDEGVAASLRTMMESVVTRGTAAQAGLPPGTAGKTGTAEVAGGATHAWFIGYRDGLAFAVLVQNGGVGGKVAAPIAARFLKAL